MTAKELLLLALAALCVALAMEPAHSAPVAEAKSEGVTVVLTDEPCALAEVTNAPNRATWTQNGKVIEGCAGLHPSGILFFWFADHTVVLLPRSAFVRVVGT